MSCGALHLEQLLKLPAVPVGGAAFFFRSCRIACLFSADKFYYHSRGEISKEYSESESANNP
jgi:hypothetical protein